MRSTNQESTTNTACTSTACAHSTGIPVATIRRDRFLPLVALSVMTVWLAVGQALAEDTGSVYDAMVLSCIDPRIEHLVQEAAEEYLEREQLESQYSHLRIAGAAVGAVAPRFKDWHKTFWENLDISLRLHQFTHVLVIDHRDCGAAREAYGPHRTRAAETALHKGAMMELKKEIHERHPQLDVRTLLIDIPDGNTKDP